MKKTILSIAALICTTAAFVQKDTTGLNIPVKDGAVVYERIMDAPGKSKADLYKNAKQWFVDYFKSSKYVIQNEDKEDGKIVGKGILFVAFRGALGSNVIYNDKLSFQVDCKENKYRVRVYEQTLSSPGNELSTTPESLIGKLLEKEKSPFNDKQARRMLESMNATITTTLFAFNKAMVAKSDDLQYRICF
ncbi:DUF4468 domain-containing protein [Mucilaginibacter aquaedulcis]|uniref:DUF4468 domain-containing protein n=1 Tax=Mucilaginibacter aquaedulcis TaxID=1187081 RepID=UPI0025B42D0C|nr:DUF4468 domain-containing protein [Mucilaginibacter aquaedulcis]MDN3548825.1 DUF4468 domain-containing protein [Mucilaginibacter aquaedulcis]